MVTICYLDAEDGNVLVLLTTSELHWYYHPLYFIFRFKDLVETKYSIENLLIL